MYCLFFVFFSQTVANMNSWRHLRLMTIHRTHIHKFLFWNPLRRVFLFFMISSGCRYMIYSIEIRDRAYKKREYLAPHSTNIRNLSYLFGPVCVRIQCMLCSSYKFTTAQIELIPGDYWHNCDINTINRVCNQQFILFIRLIN